MRDLFHITAMIAVLLTVFSCSNNNIGNETSQNGDETINMSAKKYHVLYDSLIEGYSVKMEIAQLDTSAYEGIRCWAKVSFKKDNILKFEDTLRIIWPESIVLQEDHINKLHYEKPNIDSDGLLDMNNLEMPFAFVDVDFDGIKELLITSYGTGQRTCNEFLVYRIVQADDGNYNLRYMDDFVFPDSKPGDYDRLDGLTSINYKDNTIYRYESNGINDSTGHYYKIKNGKPVLCKIEYYMDFDKVVRTEYFNK